MAESFVQGAPDGTGKKVDAYLLADGVTYQQAVAIGDGATNGLTVAVTSANALKVDGSAVTQPVSVATLPLPAGAAQDGTDATGVTAPAGAVGVRGWLSGIYAALKGTLTVSGAVTVTDTGGSLTVDTGTPGQPLNVTITGDTGGSITVDTGTPGAPLNTTNTAIQPQGAPTALTCPVEMVGAANPQGAVDSIYTDGPNLLVNDKNLSAAQSSDTPIFTAITGDPSGDFANVDLVSALFDPTQGMAAQVQIVNPQPVVPSDAPKAIYGQARDASVIFECDTTGYQSISVQLFGTWAGTVTFQTSNDPGTANFQSVAGYSSAASAAPVTTATANGVYVFPCVGRYFKAIVTSYTSGSFQAQAYLRQLPLPLLLTTPTVSAAISGNPASNTAQIAGTSTTTDGVAGTQAIGGPVAVGVAPGLHQPVIAGGIDTSGMIRRILLDTLGEVIVAGSANPSAVPLSLGYTDGQSLLDVQSQILNELRVLNQQIYELPRLLTQGQWAADDPAALRSDPTLFQ